jgi:hypothetical protein
MRIWFFLLCASCAPASDDVVALCYDYQAAYCEHVEACGEAPIEGCYAAFDARAPCETTVAVTHKFAPCLLALESSSCSTPFVIPEVCNDVIVVSP